MSQQRFWFRIGLIYVLLLIWLAGIILIEASHPLFMLGIALPWIIGFVVAKSTKVPADPTEAPFTPIVRLPYKEYDRWAAQMVRLAMNERYFSSPYMHWTQKMSLLMSIFGASLHVWAPTLCIVLLAPQDILLGLFVFSPQAKALFSQIPPEQLLGFGLVSAIVIGHLGGWAAGLFYRWLKAKW
jgi:hypothetical protein